MFLSFEVLFGSICFYLSRYCYDQYAFVPLFYNHQVGFEKEKAAQFDAGVAIDDINFIDCEMPRPSKEKKGRQRGSRRKERARRKSRARENNRERQTRKKAGEIVPP